MLAVETTSHSAALPALSLLVCHLVSWYGILEMLGRVGDLMVRNSWKMTISRSTESI